MTQTIEEFTAELTGGVSLEEIDKRNRAFNEESLRRRAEFHNAANPDTDPMDADVMIADMHRRANASLVSMRKAEVDIRQMTAARVQKSAATRVKSWLHRVRAPRQHHRARATATRGSPDSSPSSSARHKRWHGWGVS
jgi:hypothetical protein